MRLLVICSQYPPMTSPEAIHSGMLCEKLAQAGFEVHLITSILPPDAVRPVAFTIHPVIHRWSWKALGVILAKVRAIRPDAVLLIYLGWIYDHLPMVTLLPALIRRLHPSIRVVTQFENVGGIRYDFRGHRTVCSLVRLATLFPGSSKDYGTLLSASHAVITLSEIHRKELLNDCPRAASKTAVIPVPPLLDLRLEDPSEARRDGRRRLGLEDSDDTVLIAYFGYIYPGKGIETLLDAAALMKALRPAGSRNVRFVLIGTISDRNLREPLKEQCRLLSLTEGDVTWTGHLEGRDASSVLHGADLAVLPFDSGVRLNNSSFAVCCIHGLPIVTTRGAEMEAAFVHEDNVLLAEAKNAESMAEALHRVIESESLAVRLRAGAVRLSKECFSWEKTIEATTVLLSKPSASGSSANTPSA